MIGQLINKFDNYAVEKSTLAEFNSTFNTSLKGDSEAFVEIGGLCTGGLREVVIGGKLELINLCELRAKVESKPRKDKGIKRVKPNLYYAYTLKKSGEKDIVMNTTREVITFLKAGTSTLQRRVNTTQEINGYLVERVKL